MSTIRSRQTLTDQCAEAAISRRSFLYGSAAGAALSVLPTTALSSLSKSRDPRFLTIVLRGALDGLAAIPPLGDPDYAELRAGFDLTTDNTVKLDDLFGLNPNMQNLGALYKKDEALVIQATGTSYRGRSHFSGQDILESGHDLEGGSTGWLNRASERLASSVQAKPAMAVSFGHSPPLIMRGSAPVMSWAPQTLPHPDEDTVTRVIELYEAIDPELAKFLSQGVRNDRNENFENNRVKANTQFLREIDQTIEFFTDPAGPRIAALSSSGWDTHANQNPVTGRLGRLLKTLDEGIGKLHDGLAPIWSETVIVIATEFGRTAAINGSFGTDHGTASSCFVLGGAVKGGHVMADWPGLKKTALFEARDLMPTMHINGVFKGLLRDHLGLERAELDSKVFPDSVHVKAIDGLLK